MVVAALAAYKHDTLGHYLPTVLHFKLQATLFLHEFWVSNAIRLSLSTLKIIDLLKKGSAIGVILPIVGPLSLGNFSMLFAVNNNGNRTII